MPSPVNCDTDEQQKLLAKVAFHLLESVAPQAATIDTQTQALKVALQDLGKLNLLALRVPKVYCGKEFSLLNFYRCQEIMARYSGALTFLQNQHQSAASLLTKSNNQTLKKEYLPYMGRGEKLVGVGFSHLRRKGEPAVQAVSVEGGYQISGEVPWVTGYDFFTHFVVGSKLPDGQELYAIIPLATQKQSVQGKISCSEPIQLAVMKSTNTVKVKVENWFIPHSCVLFVEPVDYIYASSRKKVLHHSFFALGCAQAGLDILQRNYEKKLLPPLQTAQIALQQELTNCQKTIYQAVTDTEINFQSKLSLRAWAINLAGRCSQAAIISSSGAANSKFHPAQRVYQEALMFTVAGQTKEVMTATMDLLLNNPYLSPLTSFQ